jgi:hypothetical protein
VLGGADASHELSGLRNEGAAMVEAANERVKVLIRHSRWCVEHGLDGCGPGPNFGRRERNEEPPCINVPPEDGLCFRGRGFGEELGDGEDVVAFDGVGRVGRPAEQVENEREDLAAAKDVAVKVAVEKVVDVDLGLGGVVDRKRDGEKLGNGKGNGGGFHDRGGGQLSGMGGEMLPRVPARVSNQVVGEVAGEFAEIAPAARVRGSSEC